MSKMTFKKRLGLAVLPVLVLLAGAQPAQATALVPGTSVVPDAIVFSGLETVLASTAPAFSGTTFSGTLRAAVLDEGLANPLGGLTFVYQIVNNSISRTSLARLSNYLFGLFGTNVHFAANGSALAGGLFADGTEAPLTADRSGDGNVVAFNFTAPGAADSTKIQPGETSMTLVIRTNAPRYVPGFSDVINGGSDTVETYAPAGPLVPEPALMLLFGMGLMGMGAAARRRKVL